jgi:intracellular sulfur oxidation DsrE/DsrF family protein
MKVLMEARKKLDDINDELTFSLLKNSEDGIKEAFHKMNKMHDTILSLYARNEGTKYWIDFDIDCADEFMTKAVIDNIHNLLISAFEKKNFVMVRTPGGIHILVKKESIKKDPKILCEKIITILPQAIEVVRNINAMIPLPGTFAREKLVYILNKKDFD